MSTDATLQVITWSELSPAERERALRRPAQREQARIETLTAHIVEQVRCGGDEALRELTARFDGAAPASFRVGDDEQEAARAALGDEQRAALIAARDNVHRFHAAQEQPPLSVQTAVGVRCERVSRPIEAVGLYVPAGTAPLPSAVIMLAVPASLAGCRRRVLCTPPRPDGTADPAVLVAAQLCDVDEIYKIGGAQAIAAMAFGTESVPKVDKIFGPGNAWVTAAKMIVARWPGGAACDMPAGPSEVLVIADASARPSFVAADLLAQAEHGTDSQVLLVTDDAAMARASAAEVARQLARLPRADIAAAAIASSRAIVVGDLDQAFDLSNAYAPEHLILQVEQPRRWVARIEHAGSVFLGPWTPEALGDYCSGTNHVLPTGGQARAYSGLGVADFRKTITVQEATVEGLAAIGPTAVTLAGMERLDAHGRSVSIRLDALDEP